MWLQKSHCHWQQWALEITDFDTALHNRIAFTRNKHCAVTWLCFLVLAHRASPFLLICLGLDIPTISQQDLLFCFQTLQQYPDHSSQHIVIKIQLCMLIERILQMLQWKRLYSNGQKSTACDGWNALFAWMSYLCLMALVSWRSRTKTNALYPEIWHSALSTVTAELFDGFWKAILTK